jgi:hypothetical protein
MFYAPRTVWECITMLSSMLWFVFTDGVRNIGKRPVPALATGSIRSVPLHCPTCGRLH